MSAAADIVDAIIDDLVVRSGLGDEWDMISEEIREEIRDEWIAIVERNFKT